MSNKIEVNRRDFLRTTASAGAGLVLAFCLPSSNRGAELLLQSKTAENFAPNAYLNIHPDNKITIWVTRSEMGQGVRTALPMVLADELEADWSQIELKQASPGVTFKGIRLRTSGSGSVAGSWLPLRNAGATAREILITAAAQAWKVERNTCRAEKGTILHVPSNRRFTYGELAIAASRISIPKEPPTLKDSKDFRFIGQRMKRVDGARIVNGSAVYGFDVKMPGMRYAAIARSPVLGGKAIRWDGSKAKAIPGVLAIVTVTRGIATGVAVVAENTWAALKGRDALAVTWDEGEHKNFDSESFSGQVKAALNESGYTTRKEGDVEQSLDKAVTKIEAIYEYPFQTHAPVETMNCVANVRSNSCEIWSGTQAPETAHEDVAKMLGLNPEAVKINVPLLGGAFGRRLFVDYIHEAVEISKTINAPVQVVWTREDDMKYGFFHPVTICRLTAGLDAEKKLTVLTHKTASSDLSMFGPPERQVKAYMEGYVPWGVYDSPYFVPAYQSDYVHVDSPVPTGAWRAVGYPQNVFARECFIDEIAFAMGKDPLELRLELLQAPSVQLGSLKIERADLRYVLEIAAEKSDWKKPLAQTQDKRWGRGISCNVYHGRTLMAQVAEVSIDSNGKLKVHRVVCVVDCGLAVNPLGLEGQIESGIVWGLSAALHGKITFKQGRAEQSSYRDFQVLRMNEMPRVEVHIIPKDTRPFGIGEQPVPLIAPAVANAVFAATGKRIRSLPITAVKLL